MKNVYEELKNGRISTKCGHCKKRLKLDTQGRLPAHVGLIGHGHLCPGVGVFVGITQADVERGRVQ